jgi:very-short-patch-repair endonuclease
MNNNTLAKAKALRKNMTAAERKLWSLVRRNQLGVHFRRQAPLGPFILDFYCPAAKLVVELDGPVHDLREEKEYDKVREDHLNVRGLRVIRFNNEQILSDFSSVLEEIRTHIESCDSSKKKDSPDGN